METDNDGLITDALAADPRVAQATELMIEAVAAAQSRIAGSRPPRTELAAGYAELLERLTSARGGPPYFPYVASGMGQGPWVELADGSVKLDFISGIGVHGLGHGHPALIRSAIAAALQDTVMQGNLQQHRPSIAICERLLGLANAEGASLAHCLLTTSGAMANENALKIAFHHRAPANRLLALDHCFAGRTIATAQLTDRPQYRAGIPTALAVDYVPVEDVAHSPGSRERAWNRLDEHLRRYPGQHAALWLELVSGEGGYYASSREYFVGLIERARHANVLVIFDEVQTFGRLSRPFAFQHLGLDAYADIVTVGKLTQLCATLYRHDLVPRGPLLSQTFTAATAAIAAASVVLDELDRVGCFGDAGENVRRHAYFAQRLESLASRYPGRISGPFGCGMMVAFTPGDGTGEAAASLVRALFDAGLMGFVAGDRPARIRFLPPPAITTREHIDAAIAILDAVLRDSA